MEEKRNVCCICMEKTSHITLKTQIKNKENQFYTIIQYIKLLLSPQFIDKFVDSEQLICENCCNKMTEVGRKFEFNLKQVQNYQDSVFVKNERDENDSTKIEIKRISCCVCIKGDEDLKTFLDVNSADSCTYTEVRIFFSQLFVDYFIFSDFLICKSCGLEVSQMYVNCQELVKRLKAYRENYNSIKNARKPTGNDIKTEIKLEEELIINDDVDFDKYYDIILEKPQVTTKNYNYKGWFAMPCNCDDKNDGEIVEIKSFPNDKTIAGKMWKELFVCEYCNKKDSNFGKLIRHKGVCLKNPNVENDTIEKVFIKTDSEIFCSYCFETFETVQLRNTHEFLCKDNWNFVCEYCSSWSANISNLLIHKSRCLKNPNVQKCESCDYLYINEKDYKIHKSLHETNETIALKSTGVDEFLCSYCSEKYESTQSKILHQYLCKKNPNLYRCEKCDLAFNYKRVYNKHMKFHEKPFCCDKCPLMFSDEFEYHVHIGQHRQPGSHPKDGICEICGKHVQNLVTHKYLEHSKTIHKCELCDKTFKTVQKKKSHEKTHSDERPHECDKCDKTFKMIAHLRTHQKTHIGIKPHVCDVCNKAFTIASNLKIHKRLHTGVMPYHCEECGKEYAFSSSYLHHMRTKHEKNIPIVKRNQTISKERNENDMTGNLSASTKENKTRKGIHTKINKNTR